MRVKNIPFEVDDLKHCPFCGGPAAYAVDWRMQEVYVECTVCAATGEMFYWCEYDEYTGEPCRITYAEDAFRKAAEAWNRRV